MRVSQHTIRIRPLSEALSRRRIATVSRILALHRAEQLGKTPASKPKPPVWKKKSVAQKTSSRKRTTKKKAESPVDMPHDAIGLARPVSFKDNPGAVSVMAEAKTLSMSVQITAWSIRPAIDDCQ